MLPPPAAAPLTFDHQPALRCPFCDGDYVHMNIVEVGAREEDRAAYLITVDAIAGTVAESPAFAEGTLPSRRRHWIEIRIDCEMCSGGSVTFAQHKGQTLVSTRMAEEQVA